MIEVEYENLNKINSKLNEDNISLLAKIDELNLIIKNSANSQNEIDYKCFKEDMDNNLSRVKTNFTNDSPTSSNKITNLFDNSHDNENKCYSK